MRLGGANYRGRTLARQAAVGVDFILRQQGWPAELEGTRKPRAIHVSFFEENFGRGFTRISADQKWIEVRTLTSRQLPV
jgi:hypothetical protein